jgi:uncharacterized protein YnzC (UPF0291/DUF896 family)
MSLVEVGFKHHLIENLKNCKKIRQKYIDNIWNISLFGFLVGFLFLFLFLKYKGKLTTEEIKRRNKLKEQYILTRIKNYQDDKRKNSQNLITGLPHWSNEYDDIYKKKYVNNIII